MAQIDVTKLPVIGSVDQLANYIGHRTTSHLTFHNRPYLTKRYPTHGSVLMY